MAFTPMAMPTLHLILGLPGSGKSLEDLDERMINAFEPPTAEELTF
jgi:hypothetical protein